MSAASLSSIGMPELIAGIMAAALNAYVLLGGADYGGGVWDLLARGRRAQRQREHIAESIAPIWEANHVWLIVVVVMSFTAFPVAFQEILIVLHIPLTILLVGIVLRGSAFVFRSYGGQGPARRRWGVTFAIASTITPVLLGVVIGALASGSVGGAFSAIGSASFAAVYVAPWLAVFPILLGLLTLALFALLAAVYLAYGTVDDDLREDFRARALATAAAVFVLAAATLLAGLLQNVRIARGLLGSGWAIVLHVATAVAAVGTIVALWRRRYAGARIAAATQVSLILWGWVFAQYPYLVPDTVTIRAAAAPRFTLQLLLYGLIVGCLVLIPSLRYLLRTFPATHEIPRHR